MSDRLKKVVKHYRKMVRALESDLRWMEAVNYTDFNPPPGKGPKNEQEQLRELIKRQKELIKAYEAHIAKGT